MTHAVLELTKARLGWKNKNLQAYQGFSSKAGFPKPIPGGHPKSLDENQFPKCQKRRGLGTGWPDLRGVERGGEGGKG